MGKEIGIDFGTSNTVVSYFDKKGRPAQLTYQNRQIIPTALFFITGDEYDCGASAASRGGEKPEAFLSEFKTMLENNDFKYHIKPDQGQRFKIVARKAAQLFLNKILASAEKELVSIFGKEGTIDKIVVTVPAQFNNVGQAAVRNAVRNAFVSTGPQIRLAREPTAAAIAAIQESGDANQDMLMVYDFGGGTFDVSIIKKMPTGIYRQIATDGNKKLGGKDLTQKLMAYLLKNVNDNFGVNFPLDKRVFDEETHGIDISEYARNMDVLKTAANAIKEELSSMEESDTLLNIFVERGVSKEYSPIITREEFEDLVRPEIESTVDMVCRLLERPEVRAEGPINKLVLAGGSSQIPLVRQLLKERLPDMQISKKSDVSTIISRGALFLARKIEDLDNMTDQATALAIGIGATDGVHFNKFEMILPQGQALPCQGSKDFQLSVDGQQSLAIRYYEHDAQNYPTAVSVNDDGINEVDTIIMNLPAGLSKNDTIITLTFLANKDGSLKFIGEIKDAAGKVLQEKNVEIAVESELL